MCSKPNADYSIIGQPTSTALALVVEDNEAQREDILRVIDSCKAKYHWDTASYDGTFELKAVEDWVEQHLARAKDYDRICLHLDLSWSPKRTEDPEGWQRKHYRFLRLLLCPSDVHIRLHEDELDDGLRLIKSLSGQFIPNFSIVAVSTFGLDSLKNLAIHLGADYTVQKYPSMEMLYGETGLPLAAQGTALDVPVVSQDYERQLSIWKSRYRSDLSSMLEDLYQELLRKGRFQYAMEGQTVLSLGADDRDLYEADPALYAKMLKVRSWLSFEREDGHVLPLDRIALRQDLCSFWDWLFNYRSYQAKFHLVERLRVGLESRFAKEFIGGTSTVMHAVCRDIAKYAPSSFPILLLGEPGTGKTHLAKVIHEFSDRSSGPWVRINAAELSPELAGSDLFGHVRGAFTNATHDRPGAVKNAQAGTLFLDEIADVPLDVQRKLLDLLEEGFFRPVGSDATIAADARLIFATNRDIDQEVAAGRLRADLPRRLEKAIWIRLPPLRDRRDDIPELARHFVEKSCTRHQRSVTRISDEAMDYLVHQDWSVGNVSSLANVIEQAVFEQYGGVLQRHTIETIHRRLSNENTTEPNAEFRNRDHWLKDRILQEVARDPQAPIELIATRCGISRSTIYEKIRAYDIKSAIDRLRTPKDA